MQEEMIISNARCLQALTYRRVTSREILDLKASTSRPVGGEYPGRSGFGLVFDEKVLLDSLQAVACRGLSE